AGEHLSDGYMRAAIEVALHLAALRRERELDAPGILLRAPPRDQLALREALQDAAEVPRVESEALADVPGGGRARLRELEEHARLRQREGAVEQALVEYADLPGIKSVEAADGVDFTLAVVRAHGGIVAN